MGLFRVSLIIKLGRADIPREFLPHPLSLDALGLSCSESLSRFDLATRFLFVGMEADMLEVLGRGFAVVVETLFLHGRLRGIVS